MSTAHPAHQMDPGRVRDPDPLADELEELESVAPRRSRLKAGLRSLARSATASIAALIFVVLVVVALFADQLAPHQPDAMSLQHRMLWPVWSERASDPAFLFGTDSLGRDVLSRLIHASQMTLIVAFAAVLLSGIVGILMGLLSSYFGRWMDTVIMRLADLQLAFPSLMIGLIVMALIGSGVVELVFVIALTQWAYYARIVRSEVIKVREMEYVQAARALGASNFRIIRKHVLPNAMASLLVVASFTLAIAIYYEAALSFFGLGVPPAIPTWGNMLAEARNVLLRNQWLAIFPGVAITLTVLSFNLLGDWLRDFLDVKLD